MDQKEISLFTSTDYHVYFFFKFNSGLSCSNYIIDMLFYRILSVDNVWYLSFYDYAQHVFRWKALIEVGTNVMMID